jgi:hypothetical protein
MSNVQLDCSACKEEKSMEETKVKKFSRVLRVIGYIIAIPSAIGIIFGIIMLEAGAAFGGAIADSTSLFIGSVSLVGGLIGWLLLMKKKVFKCSNCGFILDRA